MSQYKDKSKMRENEEERALKDLYRADRTLRTHNKKLPPSARCLYLHLWCIKQQYPTQKGYFIRTINQLQEYTRLSRNTIIRGIADLEAAELLETRQKKLKNWKISRHKNRATSFKVNPPPTSTVFL